MTKKRSSFAVPQFDDLADASEDDDEPTMVHTALLGLPNTTHDESESGEEWHFQISVGISELEQLAELGLVSSETLAWRPGLPEWKRVEEIPQLELSLRQPRNSSLRPPRTPQFDGFGGDDPATAPFASPEPINDARKAPTMPPQSRRTMSGMGVPLSVLPPPPVMPAVGARRPGGSAPPLAHAFPVGGAAAAPDAPTPFWDMPAEPDAAQLASDDVAAWRSGGLVQSIRSWRPRHSLAALESRFGPRGLKIALAAGACLALGAVAWIGSAAYRDASRVETELHAAARPALQAAVKQSSIVARQAPPPAEQPPAEPAQPEAAPAEAAAAPAAPAAFGKPLDVTALATSEKQTAPAAPAPAAPAKVALQATSTEAPAAAAGKAFDAAAAQRAVDRAVGAAAACVEEGARVPGSITVTFGSNGKVKRAELGRALSSPELERCVVGAFRRASVPAFSGADGSVTKTFRLKR